VEVRFVCSAACLVRTESLMASGSHGVTACIPPSRKVQRQQRLSSLLAAGLMGILQRAATDNLQPQPQYLMLKFFLC
jgi:hypothetical protein